MRRNRMWWAALVLVAVLGGEVSAATLKNRARLREGPSASSALLGELEPGTAVEILGDTEGWKRVRTTDGRTGFVWGEHLTDVAATPPATGRRAEPSAPRTIADDVRDLRAELDKLATSADLERVRSELDRLTTAQRDLARRLDDRLVTGTAGDPPAESSFPFTPIVFVAGALAGWVGSRMMQRRRDRRQRHRLRF